MVTDEKGYHCECTTAAQPTCGGDDFYGRDDAGLCACPCHSTYSDDPENWQPLRLQSTSLTLEEVMEADDWLARMDAAEALTEEPVEEWSDDG
jgi:hypothetical protein